LDILNNIVAPEEVKFAKISEELDLQVKQLEKVEERFRAALKVSTEFYNKTNRDCNQALKDLTAIRKKVKALGYEMLKKGPSAELSLGNRLVAEYKNIIEVLAKREEKFLLVQVRKELAGLYNALGQPIPAKEYWTYSLDTIFSKF